MDIKQEAMTKTPVVLRNGWLFLFDFALLNGAYFLTNLFKRGGFGLPDGYTALLVLFYICWLCSSIITRKFEIQDVLSFRDGVFCIVKSSLYMVYFLSFAIVLSGASQLSRGQIFASCLVFFLFECMTWWLYASRAGDKSADDREPEKQVVAEKGTKGSFSISLFWMDAFLMVLAFFIANWAKRGQISLLPGYDKLFLILIGLWFTISLATDKFRDNARQSMYYSIVQWSKAGMIMLALMAVAVFGFRLFYFSRFQAFVPFVLLMGFEVCALWLYARWKKEKVRTRDVESVESVKKILDQEEIATDIDVNTLREQLMMPVREKLKARLGDKNAGLFEFVDAHVPLDEILCMEAVADNSRKIFSLTNEKMPVRLLLNLRKINDERRVNKYFLDIYQTLLPGGYFICRAHTIVTRKEWLHSKFKASRMAELAVFIDFCIHRVMPKLPFVKKVYFAVTKGKGRVISRAEVLGRVSFCGFEIVAEKVINRRLCVIARKVKTPAVNANPTYGPFVTLNRVGFNNEVVKVYKFRTMHPYSEYLQQYVFDLAGLQKGGKLENDFRTTEWGHIMRKLWLDELPMLYNWIKGELQIVGVRPLSFQYFSMYDKELQDLRGLVKPGLVPPFYVDMPETFEEIVESEKRYIRAFLKNPVKTQVVYFWKAFVNICFRGARSK